MKHKITVIAAVLLISVCILSGCGTSLQGLDTKFNLDIQNKTIDFKVDAGLLGIETNPETGDVYLDVQLDLMNKEIHCKVDTDSSGSGDGHLDFFLNWANRDTFCILDSEYPATEEEKKAGSPDISNFHFDFLLDPQQNNIDTNLNFGPYDFHLPLTEGSGNEGESAK